MSSADRRGSIGTSAPWLRSQSRRYGLAVLAVAGATALQLGLRSLGPFHLAFILFYPTVVLVAMRAGLWPGMVATLLATVSGAYFFLEPANSFVIRTPEDLVGPTLFAIIGVFLTLLTCSGKRAEQALRVSEDRYRDLIEHSEDLICTHDLAGNLISLNPAPARVLGYEVGELLNIPLREIIAPEFRDQFDAYLARIKTTGADKGLMCVLTRSGGRRIWEYNNTLRTEGVASPIVRGMAHDVTERVKTEKERKKAEEALQASELRLRTLIEGAPVAIAMGRNAVNLYGNPAFRKMFGYQSAEEVIGRPIAGYWSPEDGAVLEKRSRLRSLGQAVPSSYEGVAQRKDGTRFEVHIDTAQVDLPDGPATLAFLVDISERKRAESALRESEERFRTLYENSTIGLYRTTPDGKVLLANPSLVKMLGFSSFSELSQRNLEEEGFEPGYERTEFHRRLASEGEVKGLEASWTKRGGTAIFVRESAKAIRNTEGKIAYYEGTVEDITERKQAEEALRKSEERFSKVFRSSPLAVTISTEIEGRYLDVNEAFLQMLGYPRREVIGRTAHDLNFWQQPSQRVELIRQLKKRGRVTGFHTRSTTSKGKIRDAEVSAELVELDGQRCMLAITRDITDTRQLEEQLRQAQKMEAVGLLAGGVAHDFNNLLNVILGNADLLLEKIQSGKPQHYAEEIKKATQRATQLTRQLLAFSRKQVLRPALLDLNAVVGDVVKVLRHLIGEDVQVVVEGETNLALIWADPGQVEQILMNLATNARDAMPNGGMFTIRTENAELGPDHVARHPYVVPGRYVRLSVRDTGLGMSEDIRSRAFEPFFTTKPPGRGTGLGLATVFGIVKQSGGYVWISSALGAGTTFDIYFPRADEAAPALDGELAAQAESPKGTETILVLEDEESLREVTCEMLAGAGYSVLQAGLGGEAIALARQYTGPIQLMVSDVVLPDISGPSAVSAVQASHPETKVLFVSGYAEGSVVQKVIEARAVLLQKPVSRSDLMREVDEILHLRNPSMSN